MSKRILVAVLGVGVLLSSSGCGCPEQTASHFDSLSCSTDGGAAVLLVTPRKDLGNVNFDSATTCTVTVDAGVISLTLQSTACMVNTTAPTHNLLTAPCALGPLPTGTYEVDGKHVTVQADGGVDLTGC
jgi:hypothetical protein